MQPRARILYACLDRVRRKVMRRSTHGVRGSVRAKQILALCAGTVGLWSNPTFAQTITVTSLANTGGGSLREAITQANYLGTAAVINFNIAGGGTIPLTSMLPLLSNQNGIQIDGSNGGLGAIQISGGSTSNT